MLFSAYTNATHLVGGNLGYEFLGVLANGNYEYRITAVTYTNCDPNTSNIVDPEPTIDIGIYINDLNNPDANKLLYTDLTLILGDTMFILPDLPDDCTVGLDVCLVEGRYEAIVELPLNLGGYWLFYDRCCRNQQIVNLQDPGDQGVGFTAYIPSALVNNSSPVFTGDPTPFICAGDTTTFLNTATDPDGDQLIFSFITAKRGYSEPPPGNPAPPPPANLDWPVPDITWGGGFDENQPFGATGYSFISGATGLTSYMAPISGQYVVGVLVREYRNGILIGELTRDIQLLVLDCPENPSPNLSAINNGQTEFTVLEGDTLCFPIEFLDDNNNVIDLTSMGQIFDIGFTDPVAQLNTPISGTGQVQADFCWFTSCDQGQELPYLFTVNATDDGCPPKTTNVVYSIEVIPFTGSTFIDGNPNPCEDAEYTYETDIFPGATYDWTASGGVITSGQGTNEITVDWGSSGMGVITVVATDERGCVGDPLDLNVNIQVLPSVNAGDDVSICLGDSIDIGGSPTGPGGSVFIWAPSDSISNVNDENPTVFPSLTTNYTVQVITGFACVGEDTITVTVNTPQIDAGEDEFICENDTIQLNALNGIDYQWTSSEILSDDTISNPFAFPDSTITIFVSGNDSNLCFGSDSLTITVSELPVSNAGVDSTICGFTYQMSAIPSVGLGEWRPQAGVTYENANDPFSEVTVSSEGVYTFTWIEDNNGCRDSANVNIEFIAQPIADAGVTDSICGLVFDMAAVPSFGVGTWSEPTGITFSTNVNDPITQIFANDYGDYLFTWTEVNNGCIDSTQIQISFIEQPIANAGDNDTICGLTYLLNAVPSIGEGSWNNVGVFVPDISDPNAEVTVATPGTVELIWTETNLNFCISSDTSLITFNEIPLADAGPDLVICGQMATMNATGTGNGTWASDPDISFSDINDPAADATSMNTGIYTLVWSTELNGCTNQDVVTISFLEVPTAEAGADQEICFGDIITLNGSLGDEYLWTPNQFISDNTISNPDVNPEETTVYYLEVTLNNGCNDVDSVIVSVNPLPVIDAGEDIDYLCDGDSIQLNATPGFAQYSWVPANAVSDPGISDPYAIGNVASDYIVTVTDDNNCMNSDTVFIFVNAIVPTDAGPDVEICAGDTVQLGGSPTGPIGTTFLWAPTDNILNETDPSPLVYPDETTVYLVMSTNSICNGADEVTVTVKEAPIPAFNFELIPGCDGVRVNFYNNGDEDLDYIWDFGDGSTSTEFNPVHQYPFNIEYTIDLEAISIDECSGIITETIQSDDFDDYFQVFAPNVFTPNDDNVNDIMDINIRGEVESCTNFKVFNRWGQVMFNASGNNTRWDGYTSGGQKVIPGVYFYVIEINGSVHQGTVQVLY